MKDYYTIEKLPYRKSWSLNKYEEKINSIYPVAYFISEELALKTKNELTK